MRISLLMIVLLAGAARAAERVTVDAKFPGGNILVDKIDGDRVFLRHDLRDTAGDWFYWHFRVQNAAGRTLTFEFKSNVIGQRGPAVSTDAGKTWRWLGAANVRGNSFHFPFPEDASDVRFCVAFPYTEKNLHDFLARHKGNVNLSVESLCKTKKERNVELLRVGRLDGQAKHKIALTCRHHACEMMASFALEGIIDEALADSADGKWLRDHVEFFIVPIVDKDGVEDGDQGKNRKPHDHNRDYQDKSLYASVAAIREKLPAWGGDKLRIALDMHCPGLRGGGHETIYLVGGPNEKIWEHCVRFGQTLEKVQQGELVYRSKNNMPFGTGWNTGAAYQNKKAFSRWAAELPGIAVATTIEIAYANADGKTVTAASTRALGHDLARAFRKFLEDSQ